MSKYEDIVRKVVDENFSSYTKGHTDVIVTTMAVAIQKTVDAERSALLDVVRNRAGSKDAAAAREAMAVVEDMQMVIKRRDA